jgi:hypothetical protein
MTMRWLMIVLAAGAAFWWYRAAHQAPQLVVSPTAVQWRMGDQVSEYAPGRNVRETYMVFGANAEPTNLASAWFAGLPLARARDIHRRYPDFHRCASPGAHEAQDAIVSLRLIASAAGTDAKFALAAADHERRFAAKENRLCVKVAGRLLALEAIAVGDTRVPAAEIGGDPGTSLLLDEFEPVDCEVVLAQ